MKQPAPLRPCLLGVDPSFRATGWSVVTPDKVVLAMGVIRTATRKSKELKAKQHGDDGLYIFECLSWVLSTYRPSLVFQEANGGSKSVRAAAALARAQQACLCASARAGLSTLLCSPAALKRDTAGQGTDKDDVEGAVRAFFTGDWAKLLKAAPGYPGGKAAPPGLHDNMFDSLGAIQAQWTHPRLQALL